MSRRLRSSLKWVTGGVLVILLATGFTALSYFIQPVEITDLSHASSSPQMICAGVNYPPDDYGIPDTYLGDGKAYGWPFHFKKDIQDFYWDHCNNDVDTSNTIDLPEPSDDFIFKNFVAGIAYSSASATTA